ncbi:hypothetical protein [Ornithinimicrobium faecis]|nr:hypothetical protein [Ornithinimicrobium sp. HY1793]
MATRSYGRFVRLLVFAALMFVVAVALVAPRNSWFVFDRGLVLTTFIGVLLLGLLFQRGRTLAAWQARRPLLALCLGGALVAVGTTTYAFSAVISYGWDAGAVANAAETLSQDRHLSDHVLDYFARFPNNVPLLALEMLIVDLGHAVGFSPTMSLVLFQVFCVVVVSMCIGCIASLLKEPEWILPIQGIILVLLGLTPMVAVPYSDLPAAVCVAAGVTAMAALFRCRSGSGFYVLCSVGGCVLAFAVVLKVYTVALVLGCGVGVVAAIILVRSQRLRTRYLHGAVSASAVFLLAFMASSSVAESYTGLDDRVLSEVREPFPAVMWLASGTYDTKDASPVRRYGAYRQEMVDATAAIDDQRERRDMLWDRVESNITSQGFVATARFFVMKVAWTWADGTFWASGEGLDSRQKPQPVFNTLAPLSEVAVASGSLYPVKAAVSQGFWLAVLALLGYSLLRMRPGVLETALCTTLVVVGGYLMLFEARPRYVVAMVPVIAALLLVARARGPKEADPWA